MTCGRGRSGFRTKCAVNSRPQNSRIALTSRLQIGVDRCLVSRALQLPERGVRVRSSAGSSPAASANAALARRSDVPAQRHSPQCGGACTPLVRGQRRRDIDIGPERRAPALARGCGASPPTAATMSDASPEPRHRPGSYPPALPIAGLERLLAPPREPIRASGCQVALRQFRLAGRSSWRGLDHRLCQRVAGGRRASVAPVRRSAPSRVDCAGILVCSRDRIVPSRPYGHKIDCDHEA